MKVYTAFSSGKDSHASLIWAVNKYGNTNVIAVLCDTGWEHALTYAHAVEVCALLKVELVVLKSKKYIGLVDMAIQKKRFPSTKARFCTEELKSKPMIDFILDVAKSHVIVLQGIRKDESESRSKMNEQCRFFKHYLTPYRFDKKGKPKFHTYRKKEVLLFLNEYADDIVRPVFNWTANEVLNYIIKNGHKPNPLYYLGFPRVGCMPCIMCTKNEVKLLVTKLPDYAQRLIDAENSINALGQRSNFFGPGYIPSKYCEKKYINKKGKVVGIPSAQEVFDYVTRFASQTELDIDNNKNRSCMSYYGICE